MNFWLRSLTKNIIFRAEAEIEARSNIKSDISDVGCEEDRWIELS
jgi:hypothetical protein